MSSSALPAFPPSKPRHVARGALGQVSKITKSPSTAKNSSGSGAKLLNFIARLLGVRYSNLAPDGHDDRVTLIKLPERELVVDIQRDQQLVPGPTSACAHGENLPRRRPQAKPAFREINPTSPPGPDPRKRPALPPRPIPVWSDLFCVFCAFLRPILQSPASGSPSLRPPVLRPSATLSAAANSTVKLALRRDERHTIDGEIPMVRR